jgi:NADH-quinone oxidoreductase subunit C
LREQFGDAIQDVVQFRNEFTAVVPANQVHDVAEFMYGPLEYNYLSDLTAVDWLGRSPRFDVVYHLTSMVHFQRFRLKTQVDPGGSVPTVSDIWRAANWSEREVWDLFGIEFAGHPDLRRLLMPEGWIGHPLRKDFAQTQIALPRPKSDKVDV